MKAYLMVAANVLKSLFSYRSHILFQILGSLFSILLQFFLWKAVYKATAGGLIRGMTFNQTFLYVSLAAAISVLMRTWTDWDINALIRSGDIIMFFFKPIDYMRYVFANAMGSIGGNLVTITLPSLILIFGVFRAHLAFGANIPFFLLTLTGSCLLSFLFDFIVGTTCFWTMSVWGISTAKDFIILFLSGALIPLQFYPEALVQVIRFTPFPYMYNLPLTILTSDGACTAAWLQGAAVQLFWTAALLALARAYFNLSLRKLTVNGG